jgi:hypothetical protein
MKDILTSPRMEDMKRKRRRRRIRLFILYSVLFITIIGGLAYFSGNRRVTINKINIKGTRIINASDIQFNIENTISGKYLHLFAKSNVIIYPHDKVYDKLLKDFPRIEKLKVDRHGWNALDVDITERSGAYLYCGSKIPEAQSEIGENCYFINDDGYIFDKAPYFSGNVYFKYYATLPDTEVDPLGHQMLTSEHFHSVARLIDGITALGFKPTHLVLGGDTSTIYLDNSDSGTSPQIIFKDENNLEDILSNLTSSMAKSEFANEIRSKYTTLLYIDLRFKNKVLYKFQ